MGSEQPVMLLRPAEALFYIIEYGSFKGLRPPCGGIWSTVAASIITNIMVACA